MVVVTVCVFVVLVCVDVVTVVVEVMRPAGQPYPLIKQQYSWRSSPPLATVHNGSVRSQCLQHQLFF